MFFNLNLCDRAHDNYVIEPGVCLQVTDKNFPSVCDSKMVTTITAATASL